MTEPVGKLKGCWCTSRMYSSTTMGAGCGLHEAFPERTHLWDVPLVWHWVSPQGPERHFISICLFRFKTLHWSQWEGLDGLLGTVMLIGSPVVKQSGVSIRVPSSIWIRALSDQPHLSKSGPQRTGSFKRSIKIQVNIHKLNSMAVGKRTNTSWLWPSSSSLLSPWVIVKDKDLHAHGIWHLLVWNKNAVRSRSREQFAYYTFIIYDSHHAVCYIPTQSFKFFFFIILNVSPWGPDGRYFRSEVGGCSY